MNNIIDLYELSPMQQGMLFHSLYTPASGLYIEQRCCRIQGMEIIAFKQAWQQVCDRHSILRTAFYWEEVDKPLQVVFQSVELPWMEQDWRGFSAIEQQERLTAFLQADRVQEFVLNQAPLMRCALLQVADDTYDFIWTHHHLLLDGWCNAILLKEVFIYYEAACQGKQAVLPEPRPYRDYILWLQQQDTLQVEQFWRRTLQGFTTPTPLLNSVRQSSHLRSLFRHKQQQFALSKNTAGKLQSFVRQHHLTLNTVIQGAWAILLSRYSQLNDIVFGITVSGRSPDLASVEMMIGLFINTVPVRVECAPEMQLIPWLQQLQSQQSEQIHHSYTALVDIQAWSDVPPGTPLFESLIVFENYPVSIHDALKYTDLPLQINPLSTSNQVAQTNYPLTLAVLPSTEIVLQIDYDCERFSDQSIDQLLEHLQTLLCAFIDLPKQSLFALPMLTSAEQQQFWQWNQTHVQYANLDCIHQQIEAQVERTPDAIALVYQDYHLTYRELNARANQLARWLQQQNVNSPIGVCLDRGFDQIISLLAILKAGAAYLPLDPTYPSERLIWMLKDAQVKLVLTRSGILDLAPELRLNNIDYLQLDIHRKIIEKFNSDNPACSVALNQLAYVIYTSGSTGQPKGVMIPHRALLNYALAACEKFELTINDRVLQFASISFDTAAEEIYPTLMSGATLVLRTDEMLESNVFLQTCRDQQLTILDLPTAYWQQLTHSLIPHFLSHFLSSSLRLTIIGGEAASLDSVMAWQQTKIRLLNTYGPTEATIVSSWWDVLDKPSVVAIGQPIPNVQVYVLDDYLNPVPVGVAGELYIGGAGVALGYLNQPALTANQFIPNPFREPIANPCQSPYLYKTGDRVRYLPDGNLEFLGRFDQQIKLRGFRIELSEIESALEKHPAVQTAIVVLQTTQSDSQLIAYFTSASVAAPSSNLRQFLSQSLPSYMIPVAFVQLDAMPLTSNGKIDRVHLAARNISAELDDQPIHSIRPQTPTQELLVNIWATVLERSRIGIHDSFFELGGHSLRATQVISRIRQVFNIEIPLRQLFEHPTVVELAQVIEETRQTQQTPMAPSDRSVALPLSYAQQRQWFLAELEPDNPFYNIPAAVQVNGLLNFAALQHSFNEIVRRHEVLRTGFHTVEGQPIPKIEPISLEIPLIDLSHLPKFLQSQQVEKLADWEAKQPFALNSPPLLRIKLICLNDSKHILLITLHHIVADGWSMGILLQEIAALYPAFHQGKPSPLTELPIQYADFAAWQRCQPLTEQLTYWKKQLQNAPVLELPTAYPRPAVRSLRGASYRFQLSSSLTQSLQQLSQQMGSTLFMTLLAAFKILLHRYTDSDDIVVGTVIANRNRTELEGLIGFFANTLALRSNLANNPTFEALLHQVRETALAAYAHQDLPFEQLVDALQLQRSLSHTPLFQVLFVLQNAPMPSIEVADVSWTPLQSDSGTAKFDLTLSMQEESGYLSGTLEYSLDLFTERVIERMVVHFQTLLEAITVNPEQHLSDLTVLSSAEQQQILNWNQSSYQNLQISSVHQLFEQQVELAPDVIALVCETEQFTYRSLNAAANQLAHYLQSLGVHLGETIGFYFQRSPDLIISILAILKAGGVYLPLDPTCPAERLAFMLSDAQVKRVLTCSAIPALQTLNPLNLQQIRLDVDRHKITACSTLNPNSPITSEHLAYIMYTSGSTGTPKGICVPHRGIVRLVRQPNYVDLDGEVILQAAPLAFDASTFEIWGALLNRGRLVLLPTQQPDLEQLGQTIAQYQVSTLWLTAGLFHLMVEEQLASLKPLRQLLAGGDSLSSQHIQKLLQIYSHIRIINGYGPTENTTFTCCRTICNSDLSMTSPPIGSPISGTEVYILDRYLQTVPIGIPGELYAAGAGLAQSYLNQPTLTAEKFIPNPFTAASRLYKTGDQARYRKDGTIEYLGRLDQQVKIRGFRVELGEIETILAQHPDVQTAIITTYAEAGHKRLVAYIVPYSTCDASNLRDFLKSKLPDYMIPAAFVNLDALPLTANGKVNRLALPAPILPSTSATAPRTETETTLSQIWASVLGVQVGVHDNFFEQGGDSILAIQIVSRANQAGLKITPKQVFQHQTIAELATVAGKASGAGVLAEQGEIIGKVPLTPIQHWFFEQALPHPHHYNQAVLLRVKAPLHQQYLEQAIVALLHHHDALRLQLMETETGWQQQIILQDHFPLTCFDYSHLSATQPLEAVEPIIEQAAQQLQASLNLSTHLVQVAWFKLGESHSDLLLFIVHHLAIDGVSWRILLEDFQSAYQQLTQAQTVQLPAKTTSFKQWAERLQSYAASDINQQELKYWSSQSQRCQNHFALPVDNPKGENTGATSEQIRVSLSIEQTQALLTEVPKAYNTRIQEVLLTALVQTLTQWIGYNSLLVDVENHGRESQWNDIDLSRTVGWFTAIAPILLTVESDQIEVNLQQVKEQIRTIPNHGIGYGILRYLKTDSVILNIPQPEISFNYLGQFGSTDPVSTLVERVEQPIGRTLIGATQSLLQPRRYRIEINGAITAGQLYLDWSYSRQQYHRSTMARLTQSFQDALLQLIEHCQNPDVVGYTPSDFALAQLDHSQLEAVLAQVTFETDETGGEA